MFLGLPNLRQVTRLTVCATLFAIVGCGWFHSSTAMGRPRFVNNTQMPDSGIVEQCQSLPEEARKKVHFFCLNSTVDFLGVGNLKGTSDAIRCAGFPNVYYYHSTVSYGTIRDRIIEVRKCDPDAKIVLLGYSAAANCVRSMAHGLKRRDVEIDLLIYLGGDTISNRDYSRPENVRKILNLNANGFLLTGGNLLFKGTDIDGAENHRYRIAHLGLPSHHCTIAAILRNLYELSTNQGTAPIPYYSNRTPTEMILPPGK